MGWGGVQTQKEVPSWGSESGATLLLREVPWPLDSETEPASGSVFQECSLNPTKEVKGQCRLCRGAAALAQPRGGDVPSQHTAHRNRSAARAGLGQAGPWCRGPGSAPAVLWVPLAPGGSAGYSPHTCEVHVGRASWEQGSWHSAGPLRLLTLASSQLRSQKPRSQRT